MYDERRFPLFLLTNILGGPGMNSRLNVAMRERNGLVYNVEANTTLYTDTGLASVYFGTDPKNREKACALLYKELSKLRDVKLSTTQLAAAKKQIKGQLGVSNDNREDLFLSFGKSGLHYHCYNSLSEIFDKIDQVKAEDILAAANEVFAPEHLFTLNYE
jgi:predicted Zn-dependent peptidase